jgi:pimeloyl-ACP methyl ester carboxylesterase
MRWCIAILGAALVVLVPFAAKAQSTCDPDGLQASGSIYRICMPPADKYNGILVIWAHGFQDAGTPVSIPEDQLCLSDFCINELVNSLGFGFATNSYSKTGLAVVQGREDVADLAKIFATVKGTPKKVYLIGASEGGLITAQNIERRPDVFSAGIAACGPVGNFPLEINYFGDSRVTFEYFFPGLIPGAPLDPAPGLAEIWREYYKLNVEPVIFDPANRHLLDQWAAVAKLPFDADNYLDTVRVSVEDVLRYSVVNIADASKTIGGSVFNNRIKWYSGSDNDVLLNKLVVRSSADAAALAEMNTNYNTTGVLQRPLITLHTLRDQQVPYWHEQLYTLKTLASGSFLTRHLNIPVNRFEHCNFTKGDALFSFAVMLFYDGVIDQVSGTAAYLSPADQKEFETRARSVGLPTRAAGAALALRIKQ